MSADPTEGEANWLEAVRLVVAAVRSSDISELKLANATFSVRLRREPSPPSAPADAQHAETQHADTHVHHVLAPFTGVFYRSPTPAARAYVNEGDWVDADAVIGLVETMKIFNEVTADVSGRITRFEAESGQLVHASDTLVLIEPSERTTPESEVYV